MRARLVLQLLVAGVLVATAATPAFATFSTSTTVTQAPVSATTLTPPTDLATSCTLGLQVNAVLTWTATTSPRANGYEVLRSTTSGSGYASVATVAGATTSTYTDHPPISLNTSYY